MRIDFFTDTDGFRYCCKQIPYLTIEARKGVLIDLRTGRPVGKKIILYKHYIKDGALLIEPCLDEDIYDIRGGEKNDCIRTLCTNEDF